MAYAYTSSVVSGWDCWAVSVDGLVDLGYFEFSFNAPSGAVCGVSESGISEDYTEIRHGFYVEQNEYQVMERGAVRTEKAACTSSTRFKIQRTQDGKIRYFVDGAQVYETSLDSTIRHETLYLYAVLYTFGEQIVDAVLVPLAENISLDLDLPGYLCFGVTDAVDALLGANLPALDVEVLAEGGRYVDAQIPAYVGFISVDDVSFIDTSLPALDLSCSLTEQQLLWSFGEIPGYIGAGIALSPGEEPGDYAFLTGLLPAYDGSLHQSDVLPNPISIHATIPALASWSEAVESSFVETELPPLFSAGMALSSDDPVDVAIVATEFPAYEATLQLAAKNFILVRVPAPRFLWFGVQDYISEEISFAGWMEGGQTGAWIDEILPLDFGGDMFGGGWVASAIISGLAGEMDGGVQALGDIAGMPVSLSGEIYAGGNLSGVLTTITGTTVGFAEYQATISGGLSFGGFMAGSTEFSGLVSGQLPGFLGTMNGMAFVNGALAGSVVDLKGSLSGAVPVDGQAEGELTYLLGRIDAGALPGGDIDVELFSLAGALSSLGIEGSAQCVTMRYSRF